jgi:hypothetical protein
VKDSRVDYEVLDVTAGIVSAGYVRCLERYEHTALYAIDSAVIVVVEMPMIGRTPSTTCRERGFNLTLADKDEQDTLVWVMVDGLMFCVCATGHLMMSSFQTSEDVRYDNTRPCTTVSPHRAYIETLRRAPIAPQNVGSV